MPWRRGPASVTGPLVGIAALAFLSIPGAVSPSFAFYVAVRWLLAIFLYFLFLQPVVPVRPLAAVLAVSLGLHALVGIAQVVVQGPLSLPGELALAPNMPGASVVLVHGMPWLRAYGLAFHPNVLGGFLVVALLLLVPWLERLPAAGLWWLLWCALLLTFSRAAWLGMALTLPVALLYFYVKRRGVRPMAALAAFGAFALSLAFFLAASEQVATRFNPLLDLALSSDDMLSAPATEAFSISERSALNEVAWQVIAGHPARGIGAGNFPLAMPLLRPLMRAQSVHNVPLLLASEVGILGGVLWLFMTVAVAVRFLRHRRKTTPWLFSAICAWLALAIISLFDSYPWSLYSGLTLTMMILGLASRSRRDRA